MIGSSVFLLGLIMVIYGALGYYGRQVLAGAAQEGAVHAATVEGTEDEGAELTNRLIAESSGSLFTAWNVSSSIEGHSGPDPSAAGGALGGAGDRVVIVAVAEMVGPFGTWSIEARGTAPVEAFRPQGG